VYVSTSSPPVARHPRRSQAGNPFIELFSFGRPPLASRLQTAADYEKILTASGRKSAASIAIRIDSKQIEVKDTAPGISATAAQDHVFKFGRSAADKNTSDRLSVYGIGLKRALFKIGNRIQMRSDHREGGFYLDLNVREWESKPELPWKFDIFTRPPVRKDQCGTELKVTELYPDVERRIQDGVFVRQLRERIARTYSFFLGRVVDIEVEGQRVEPTPFDIGANYATDKFTSDSVTCAITAGIAMPDTRSTFAASNAGWFVFCNGRTVIYADKTPLTGWTGAPGLPIFQPKHRPFLGVVFFVSPDPEALPWSTTKSSVNEDSVVWQEAKRRMVIVGKEVTAFLDRRYSDDGTEITGDELRQIGGRPTNVLTLATAAQQRFRPTRKEPPRQLRVQYWADRAEIQRIANYLRRPTMGGADVGRYTFEYFLKNRVDADG
jgi:hypothetical protein